MLITFTYAYMLITLAHVYIMLIAFMHAYANDVLTPVQTPIG